jgi:hypothetical protein
MAQVNLFAQIGSSLCWPDMEECVFHCVTDILNPQTDYSPFYRSFL